MILRDGVWERERATGRLGQVKVLSHLDWAEVEWEDKPGELALVHTSRLVLHSFEPKEAS
jgi:hypothetical protein